MHLDLADTKSISSAAKQFLDRETKLHVLFNNAGLMTPPRGSTTAQGYELQFGVNNVGTFMFTKLLTPLIVETAKSESPGTVRVIWVSSSAAEAPVVPTGGIDIDDIVNRGNKHPFVSYSLSKAGNYLHAVEMAKRFKDQGIVSIALNPGNLKSDLWREQSLITNWFLNTFILHDPIYGAYTELFAGLSPEITLKETGQWGESSSLPFCNKANLVQLAHGVAFLLCEMISCCRPRARRRVDTELPGSFGNGPRLRLTSISKDCLRWPSVFGV